MTMRNSSRLWRIGRGLATDLVASVSNLPVLWHRDEELCANECSLAMELDKPAYDSVYLALGYRAGAGVFYQQIFILQTR